MFITVSLLPVQSHSNYSCSGAGVKQLARGVEEVVGAFEMEQLVTERSNRHEAHLEQLLARVDYEIPSVEMVSLYFDDNHVEHVSSDVSDRSRH